MYRPPRRLLNALHYKFQRHANFMTASMAHVKKGENFTFPPSVLREKMFLSHLSYPGLFRVTEWCALCSRFRNKCHNVDQSVVCHWENYEMLLFSNSMSTLPQYRYELALFFPTYYENCKQTDKYFLLMAILLVSGPSLRGDLEKPTRGPSLEQCLCTRLYPSRPAVSKS